MKIAVIHLTRMQRGFVCVAGVDVADGRQIRPVIPRGRLPDTLTARRGGPFDMATVVDLGDVRAVGEPPDVEDYEFTQWHARATQSIDPVLFWQMLTYISRSSLRDIFGPKLRTVGWTGAGVSVGTGTASLGCLKPADQPTLYLTTGADGLPRPRLHITDGTFKLDLAVNDLRFFGADNATVRQDYFEAAVRRVEEGMPILASVGLTRAFASNPGSEPVHWLQVNNLHFADAPAWRLTPFQPPALVGSGVGGDLDDDLPF